MPPGPGLRSAAISSCGPRELEGMQLTLSYRDPEAIDLDTRACFHLDFFLSYRVIHDWR